MYSERSYINQLRDIKLEELRKRHLGVRPRTHFSRELLNQMRDSLRAVIRKHLEPKCRGRPKKAVSLLREGFDPLNRSVIRSGPTVG
jgi:DNA-binding TFAR19-related protein (PDSD5 family)